MATLISTWDPNKEYNKLDLVRFMSSSHILTYPVKAGTLPIKLRSISNGAGSYSNRKFMDQLKKHYGDSIKDNDDNAWHRLT